MKKFIIPVIALMPAFAHAQELTNIRELLESIGDLVDIALPLIVGLALLGFFWGLAKFIFQQGNEEQKVEAKKIMLWAVIALFVMVSVWGLVGFIGSALGVGEGSGNNPNSVDVPTVQDL